MSASDPMNARAGVHTHYTFILKAHFSSSRRRNTFRSILCWKYRGAHTKSWGNTVRDELLYYYERELTFLRHMGAEFAERYPKVAGRLLLESGKCEDPHVERLLEGFAFLAARVHLKVDDEFPEIVEAMFNVLYPHFLRPVPSMSVVQFHPDREQGRLTSGLVIPRESVLYSAPVNGAPCKFRTCYDTTIWPFRVSSAEWKPVDRIKPPLSGASAWAALRL